MGYNQEISVREVQIYQEYQIALSGSSASSALALSFLLNPVTQTADPQQVIILEARGDNVIFNFGSSTIAASKTLTSSALPAGNFSIAEGAIFGTVINGGYQGYVSCIAESGGSGTTFGIVRLGRFAL